MDVNFATFIKGWAERGWRPTFRLQKGDHPAPDRDVHPAEERQAGGELSYDRVFGCGWRGYSSMKRGVEKDGRSQEDHFVEERAAGTEAPSISHEHGNARNEHQYETH
jgi:hypothetical protein